MCFIAESWVNSEDDVIEVFVLKDLDIRLMLLKGRIDLEVE